MEQLIQYIGNHPWLSLAAVLAVAMVLVYELRTRAALAASVSPQEAVLMMNRGAAILDIRPQAQFAAGHVTGARHVPSDQILEAKETLKKYKEKPLIVYCDSGSLGAAAVRQLAEQGFKQAVNLRGGLKAWRAENLPVIQG